MHISVGICHDFFNILNVASGNSCRVRRLICLLMHAVYPRVKFGFGACNMGKIDPKQILIVQIGLSGDCCNTPWCRFCVGGGSLAHVSCEDLSCVLLPVVLLLSEVASDLSFM